MKRKRRVDDFTNETLEPQNLYRLRYDLTNEVDTSRFEFPQGATDWKRAAWVPRLVKLRDKLNSNYGEGTHWIEVEEEVDENEERLRLFNEREAERIRIESQYKASQEETGNLLDDTMDKLLDASAITVDKEKRGELFTRVQEILYEELPVVPIVCQTSTIAVNKRIKGVKHSILPLTRNIHEWEIQ